VPAGDVDEQKGRQADFMTDEQVKDVLPSFNAFHPLGRNGQPKDVAKAILFLASDQAAWITGTVGGVTAGRQ
jgi:NAD(P)-dependent dehydrogenase (short-subunit alcohol dehydrogenase family)